MSAMALQKPATMWVSHLPSDATFAFGLLHGVYPMAPAPSGDHSLGMSGMAIYLKYGPMLRALQGRVWNLEGHSISASIDKASFGAVNDSARGSGIGVDANLFDLPDGSSIAVLALRGATTATVTVKLARLAAESTASPAPNDISLHIDVLQLGRVETWTPIKASSGLVQLEIKSTIAMLRMADPTAI
eukprot:COSAG02_NODE_5581_length_4215_cov_1.971817_5_plen_188_part_00